MKKKLKYTLILSSILAVVSILNFEPKETNEVPTASSSSITSKAPPRDSAHITADPILKKHTEHDKEETAHSKTAETSTLVHELKESLHELDEDKDHEEIEYLIEELLNLDPENSYALKKLVSIQINAKMDYVNGMDNIEKLLEDDISQGKLVQLYFEAAKFGGLEDRAIDFLLGFKDSADENEFPLIMHYIEKLEASKRNNDN